MSHKIKAFLVSLVTGFLFTLLVLGTEVAIAKVYLHPFAVAITVVLWFFYSIILWGGFFKDVPQGEPLLSPRLFKSFAVGLVSVLVILGSMLLLGRMGTPHPMAITEVRNINAAGVMFIWIFIAGLLFEGMFNSNRKNFQVTSTVSVSGQHLLPFSFSKNLPPKKNLPVRHSPKGDGGKLSSTFAKASVDKSVRLSKPYEAQPSFRPPPFRIFAGACRRVLDAKYLSSRRRGAVKLVE